VRLADWFTAPVRGATVDGVSSQHWVRLAAGLGRLAAAGVITFTDGRSYRFTAPLAAPGGPAGLFEGTGRLDGLAYHAGWIVLPGRDQRGATGYPQGPLEGHAIAYFPVGLV
jgi:hypothetical protein